MELPAAGCLLGVGCTRHRQGTSTARMHFLLLSVVAQLPAIAATEESLLPPGMPPLPLAPRPSRQSSGMSVLFDNTPRTAREGGADLTPADAAGTAAGGPASQAARVQAGSAAASAAPTPMMTPMQPSLGPAFGTGANPMLNITPLTGMAPLRMRSAAAGLQHDLDQPSSGSSTPTANGSVRPLPALFAALFA